MAGYQEEACQGCAGIIKHDDYCEVLKNYLLKFEVVND